MSTHMAPLSQVPKLNQLLNFPVLSALRLNRADSRLVVMIPRNCLSLSELSFNIYCTIPEPLKFIDKRREVRGERILR